ncbi:MAG: SRPBCC family protein [Alphaproteobacteria bacterium]
MARPWCENSYRADITLGIGVVRGRFRAEVQLSDLDPPNAATLSGGLSGPLGASSGEGRVRLAPAEGGTKVSYDYSIEISGKVAAVGGRLLDGATRVLVGQFFERLVAQVGGGSAAPSLWRRLLGLLGIGK